MTYLTIDRVIDQEAGVEDTTREQLVRCLDLHHRAINALIRIVYWIPVADPLTDEGKVRIQARMWLHSATHSFRAAEMLALSGYYLEAQVIHRHLVEVLVKMRYFYKHPNVLENFTILKPAPIQFKAMFDEVMPGYYEEYKHSLAYPAHGGVGASAYRVQHDSIGTRTLDTGVIYKEFWATAFVNQQYVFLLGYLRTYLKIFPELLAAMLLPERRELTDVEAALEDVIRQHVQFKGGENSWHKAAFSVWNW